MVSEKKIFEVFTIYIYGKPMTPQGGANIDPRGIIWTILVELHQMMLHAKYLSPRPCGFGEEDFWSFFFRLPWQPEFFMEWNSLNNFERPSCKEHFCQVSLNLVERFRRRSCLKKLLTDGRTDARTHARTDDGRRTTRCHNSSPWALRAQVS